MQYFIRMGQKSLCDASVMIDFLSFDWRKNANKKRFHGKEEVKAGGRYTITLEQDQTLYHMARLEITKVVTGDKGEYRAVARNMHGEGVATINLNFEGTDKPKYIPFMHLCKHFRLYFVIWFY